MVVARSDVSQTQVVGERPIQLYRQRHLSSYELTEPEFEPKP